MDRTLGPGRSRPHEQEYSIAPGAQAWPCEIAACGSETTSGQVVPLQLKGAGAPPGTLVWNRPVPAGVGQLVEDPGGTMRIRAAGAAAALLLCATGCHHGGGSAQRPVASPSSDEHASPFPTHRGSLSAHEKALATRLAKHQQRAVIGTFIGATAFVTTGTPFDRGSECDVDRPVLNIRLVWEADANFVHSHVDGSPPDGPRKAGLIVVDPRTGQICEVGARYRHVGARPRETLLYGEWPVSADG
jgi:hypothetical protein